MKTAATHEVVRVIMQSEFWNEDEEQFVLYEYALNRQEWREYLRAHRLANWIPFSCAATWMSADLELLICGHKPERYTRIELGATRKVK